MAEPIPKRILAVDVKTAVQQIVPYLEDTSNDAPQFIYFNGWFGLGASAVLRAIAEQPPPSLREKFDKIIHIDCSMWKSRRALQRVIAEELKLTQQVVAIDAQDEEDDFSGVDHGSRAEVRGVMAAITRYLVQYRCLVVFRNGSDGMVDLTSCGIPQPEIFNTKVLWTFRGRLRLNSGIYTKVDASHLFLYADDDHSKNWNAYLAEEAREISLYTYKLGLGVTPEVVTECCLYLLSLNYQGKKMIDYNWATHASSYWVCDGIMGGQDNQIWEVAHALQQHIKLEDYSPNTELMPPVNRLDLSSKQWISITESYFKEVTPDTTSLFFAPDKSSARVLSLPSDKFHKADQLRVLKLYGCNFSFSSPPFHCCRNLRFLGLDRCKDELQQGEEEEKKRGEPAVEVFQQLWVLDVCHTDWPLAFPPETEEQVVATDIREVHITNGRIWTSNLAWRRLPNLHKLRVVEPTNPCWETAARDDEFKDMVNLELLDLSGNSTIQVLPSLSSATGLKTLVLDGCVGLEHIGPQQLPPSLESFSLNIPGADEDHKKKAKISYISLAGCARLVDFILCGSLPDLEELDLSHTSVKMLDLGKVVEMENLQRVLLMGCGHLRSIAWPKTKMSKLKLLCIDTRASGGEVTNRTPWLHDSVIVYQQDEVKEYCHASVAAADMRFLQSLEFLWTRETIQCDKWNLCLSSTSNDDGRSHHKEKMGRPYSTGQLADAESLPKSLTYHDIIIEQISAKSDISTSSSSAQFLPLDLHMEIGKGISDVTDKSSTPARNAIRSVMNTIQSLHVHDSSSITGVAPEHIFMPMGDPWRIMNGLKWCRMERCPKLDTVFATNYLWSCFYELEIFWAAHLLMARSIWSRPSDQMLYPPDLSFTQLRAIHLHYCPRLRYVLPMASNNTLSKVLETLHIHCCGDLKQVFLVEQEFLEKIAAWHGKGMLEFSNLKSLYLYELPSLQHICEAKLFAPKLETIHIRGCWSLRRLPATDSRRRQDGRPVAVDCEKDWWDKLEWDGMESGHHPSLFEPRHSRYYKRRHLRSTVLR